MSFLNKYPRTHYCGDLTEAVAGNSVTVMGWCDNRRDHGGLIFFDLRDREGKVQVVIDPAKHPDAKSIRNEFVLGINGDCNERPEGMKNSKIKTGGVEVIANEVEIFSTAETLPFELNDNRVSENLRLQYRYLDLRSENMQKCLITRHKVCQSVREYFSGNGFIEVETPILYKSTPEGARDYLVPSRVHQGEFYALPQSPQTLKQLLMIGGYDRYFQIAKCFRDEDLRADRQPEFSQIDVEMSFVNEEDIKKMTEGLARKLWKEVKNKEIPEIPRFKYSEAMARFGSDKPDLRINFELNDIEELAEKTEFKVFKDNLSQGGKVSALCVPGVAGSLSRSKIDNLTKFVKGYGAKGLVWIKWQDEVTSAISKFVSEDWLKEVFQKCGGKKGDVCFIVSDQESTTYNSLGALRIHLAKEFDLIDVSEDKFCWVEEFPLLDYDADEKRWVAVHHPFTDPSEESKEALLAGDYSPSMSSKAYDFVCNGHEIAGGSLRIYQQEIQKEIFKALGFSDEETRKRFGFFVDALKYGVPPHGGIAWGLDRLCMILSGTEAIRDVIAFPKTTKASDLMASCPSSVDSEQLIDLGIRIREKQT